MMKMKTDSNIAVGFFVIHKRYMMDIFWIHGFLVYRRFIFGEYYATILN